MKRVPELDAMRGLAAVAIVFYHLWLITYGFVGTAVDLFFVMSGYLITAIIIKQRDQPGFLVTFFARRSLRIWPIYYLSLAAYLVARPALPHPGSLEGLSYFLTYTQNLPEYWGGSNPPFAHEFSHTWSLAVEEQYYLIWPLLLVAFGRRSVVPLALALVALAVGARMGGYTKWLLLTRCDGLALGGILASVMHRLEVGRLEARTLHRWLVGIGVGSLGFLILGGRVLAKVDAGPLVALSLRMLAINLMYFALIGLVVRASGGRWLAWLRDRRLVALGQMSYGIYLYHMIFYYLVADFAATWGVTSRLVVDPIRLALTFGTAAASWYLVEKPLLSLKDRFTYKPRARALADVPRLETLGAEAR